MNMKLKTPAEQSERTSTQVFALLAALALSVLLASGCSVPVVSGNSVDSSSSSAAYSSCTRVLIQNGHNTYSCDTVTSPYSTTPTYSYNHYTYSKTGLTSQVSEQEMKTAYAAYLSTLSPEALADMSAQWNQIAKANSL